MLPKYDVFISYSRKDIDLAENLSKRIRRYKPPKAAQLKKQNLIVFRDIERLTAASDLTDELVEKLDDSKQLLLLCSPDSAKSKWVRKEVDRFIKTKGLDFIIFTLVRGELEESLPPSLNELDGPPLYIDLRNLSSKHFRTESLRIIAALHGVDFAVLLREDDARRRRINRIVFISVFIFFFALFSAYLIINTKPKIWNQIEQPEVADATGPMPLLPVHDIVVNRKNPSEVLFLGQNAAWDSLAQYFYLTPDEPLEFPDSTILELLYNKKSGLNIARVDFEMTDDYETSGGKGTLHISAILDEHSKLRYVRSMTFEGITEEGHFKKIAINPTLLPSDENPFDLGRLMQEIIAVGFYLGEVYGTVFDYLNNTKIEALYSDEDDSFSYGNTREQIYGNRYKIFLNNYEIDYEVLGRILFDEQHNRTYWDAIVESTEWETFTFPVKKSASYAELTYDEEDKNNEKAILNIEKDLQELRKSKTLKKLLKRFILAGDYSYQDIITTKTSVGQADILKIECFALPSGTGDVSSLGIDWLIRLSGLSDWQNLNGIQSDQLLGIWALDSLGKDALLLTGDQGFYRTQNGGETWEEANYNETGFTEGNKVKVILVDQENVFALIDRGNLRADGQNPFFQLKERNLFERWKIGLINILE